MRNGSVGLVNTSRPPGRSGAMGRFSTAITSTDCTMNHPTRVATTITSRLFRMRQRSSSRWSRKGISPRGAGSGTGPPEREGARGTLVPGVDTQELTEPEPGRAEAATAELLEGEIVHVRRTGTGRVPGRTDRCPGGARVQRWDGLLGPLLDPGPELREALLALARQLLHRDELLLHADQVRADVAAELDEIGLLGRDRLLHGGEQLEHGVDLRRPVGVGARGVGLQRRDLELHLPDIPLEGAAGGEPQAEDERYVARHGRPPTGAATRHRRREFRTRRGGSAPTPFRRGPARSAAPRHTTRSRCDPRRCRGSRRTASPRWRAGCRARGCTRPTRARRSARRSGSASWDSPAGSRSSDPARRRRPGGYSTCRSRSGSSSRASYARLPSCAPWRQANRPPAAGQSAPPPRAPARRPLRAPGGRPPPARRPRWRQRWAAGQAAAADCPRTRRAPPPRDSSAPAMVGVSSSPSLPGLRGGSSSLRKPWRPCRQPRAALLQQRADTTGLQIDNPELPIPRAVRHEAEMTAVGRPGWILVPPDRGELPYGARPHVEHEDLQRAGDVAVKRDRLSVAFRSEEHTSELQSLAYLVCRLLLEKKK